MGRLQKNKQKAYSLLFQWHIHNLKIEREGGATVPHWEAEMDAFKSQILSLVANNKGLGLWIASEEEAIKREAELTYGVFGKKRAGNVKHLKGI